MSAQANIEALRDRITGEQVGRFRALTMAGTAGIGVAVVVYRLLREDGD